MYYDRVIVNNNSYILGATSKGLSFVGSMNKDVSEIYQFYPGVSLTSDKKVTDRYVQEISAYLRKQRYDFDLSIDISGTDFQNDVWKELLRIPYGKTRNYTQIAEQIDRKKAVRAVGTAIGKNPLLMVIPCHRVLTKQNKLGGYRGGLEMKRNLLRLEGIKI